jgi:regulator of sigma E protease
VTLGIRRGGRVIDVTVYPRYSAAAKRMRIGFEFGLTVKPVGLFASAGGAASAMWNVTAETVTGLASALTSPKKRGELHSVVGIVQANHEYAQAGAGYELVFLGFLSLVLAVINLFPFLPLDGGHVLWSVVGIVLMLFLFVNGLGNDIGRLT